MKHLLMFFSCLFFLHFSNAQSSDILVLKKNLKTVKTYFPGTEINVNTDEGYYDGIITSIRKDSVFIIHYDIRQIPSNLGIYFLDTIATYRYGINYKSIIALNKPYDSKKFNWSGSGGTLFGGGILITTVGLGTWLFTKPNTRYHASPYLIGGAAVLAGLGYLLIKSGNKGMEIGKKYSLLYIHVN